MTFLRRMRLLTQRVVQYSLICFSGGAQQWDQSIQEANDIYRGRMHNLFCDNCHSHVACALNRMPMQAYTISKWNMVKLCFLVFFRARFLSWSAVFSQFGPFLMLIAIILLSTELT